MRRRMITFSELLSFVVANAVADPSLYFHPPQGEPRVWLLYFPLNNAVLRALPCRCAILRNDGVQTGGAPLERQHSVR